MNFIKIKLTQMMKLKLLIIFIIYVSLLLIVLGAASTATLMNAAIVLLYAIGFAGIILYLQLMCIAGLYISFPMFFNAVDSGKFRVILVPNVKGIVYAFYAWYPRFIKRVLDTLSKDS